MFKRIISLITAFAFMFTQTGYAAMITADGKTDTTVVSNGNVYDVYTNTVSGKTGFNSFSNFDVYQGHTANLYLPDNTANLVNLVNGKQSQIDGILNSYKNGQIGGNVFFLNSNGIVIGASGTVNVGALTLATPTKEFMDGVIAQDRSVSTALTQAILAGDIPLNPLGLVSVKGKINAANGAGVFAGSVKNEGQIKTDFNTADIVNTDGVVMDNTVAVKDGKIIITAAKDFVNDGEISAKNSTVNINAGQDVILNAGSKITAAAKDNIADGGTINILAQRDAYFNAGAGIDVSSYGGNGGFAELSAKDNVYLNGGVFNAASVLGEGGTILIDPTNLTISTSFASNGANYTMSADDTITINDGIYITTTKTNDNAGNISLSAQHIDIGDNVLLDAKADSTHTSGDITIKALDSSDGYIIKNNNASVSVGKNTVIQGKNVDISAEANNKLLFDDESKITDTIGNVTLGSLADMGLIGSYVESTVNSSVDIDEGADIKASGTLNVSSKAVSDASLMVPSTGISVAVGKADVDSSVNIANGAKLTSGGAMTVQSTADTKMSVAAMALSTAATTAVPGDGAVGVGIMNSDNTVTVNNGATLTSDGGMTIKADTTKDMKVTSSASAFDDGTFGVAVTYSQADVNNKVNMDGNLRSAGGNAQVISTIDSVKNRSTASAGAGSSTVTFYVAKAMNYAIDGIKSKLNFSSINTAQQSHASIGIGAAVSYSEHTNTAEAKIGSDADVQSAGDFTVKSSVTDQLIRQAATASVDSKSTKDSGSYTKENGGAAAVAVSKYTDNSTAFVDSNAQIDLSGKLDILSIYSLPYEITWYKIEGISDITDKLNGNLGLQNGFINTWAMATVTTEGEDGGSGTFGFAGSFNVADYNSSNKAYIASSAKINQRDIYSSHGAVNVKANSDVSTINFAGNTGLTLAGDTAKTGLGASYVQVGYDTDTEAYIGDNAKVAGASLLVESSVLKRDITMAVSGGKAEGFGFNGAFSWVDSTNNTLSHISDSAQITTTGNLGVTADDDSTIFNIAGGIVKSKNIGIGAAVGLSDLTRNTRAYIGQAEGATLSLPSDYSGANLINSADVNVSATQDGDIYAYSLAGSVETGANQTEEKDSEGGGGKYGIGISGDVSYNNVNNTILSYIYGGYINAANISLTAQDDTHINTVSGAASLITGGETSVGFAGSASVNYITNRIASAVKDSSVAGSSLIALSDSYSHVQSVAASGTGAVASGVGVAVAGSVAVNNITNDISSSADNSNITASAGDASFTAKDDSELTVVAGGVSVSKTVGIGSSVGVNKITSTVASSANADITAHNIIADAQNNSSIVDVSGTLGVATEGAALSASVSVNNITNNTTASSNGTLTSDTGDITINAKDTSSITGVAGSVAGADKAGVGISTAVTTINNTTKAYASGATLTTKQNAKITAVEAATAHTAAAGGGFAGNVGVAGSVAVNNINTLAEAKSTSSNITTDGSALVSATSNNTVNFYGGTLSGGGTAGLGGTVAVNNVSDKSSATISGGTLEVKGLNAVKNYKDEDSYGLITQAQTNDDINVWTFNASAAGTTAITGAVSVSNIDNSANALIENATVNSAADDTYSAAQDIAVLAQNKADIATYGGALSVAGTAGFGAVSDTVIIKNDTSAKIKNSILNAKNDIIAKTDTLERYNSLLISGGFAGDAGVAGNVVVANLENTNNVLADGSTLNAGGDITANANDEVDLGDSDQIAVGAAGGGLYAGIGGAVLVTNTKNTTSAIINDTDATAEGAVDVYAYAKQRVKSYVPTLGAGLGGIAASVAVNTLDSDTEAYVSGGSDITSNKTASDSGISVKAESDSKINNLLASTALGGVGVGAAVSVSKVNGKTAAGVKDASSLTANNAKASVTATNTRTIDDMTVAAAAGGSALSGSVAIGNIGTNMDSDSLSSTQDSQSIVDAELARNGGITAADLGRDGLTDDTATAMATFVTNTDSAFSTAAAADKSTAAYVGANSSVNAKNAAITASDTASLKMDAGGGALGLGYVAVGGAVAIGSVNNSAKAYTGENAEVNGTDSISITATNNVADSDVNAYFGVASPFSLALGAAVAIVNSTNTTMAYADHYSRLSGSDISIMAQSLSDIKANSLNVAAGTVAAGAGVSKVTKSGDTLAYLGDNVTVGEDSSSNATGDLSVSATTNHNLETDATAGTGGIVAGNGTNSEVTLSGKVNSAAGSHTNIYLTGNLDITTGGYAIVTAKSFGVSAGALAVGAAITKTTINLDNSVNLAGNNTIKADSAQFAANQTKAQTNIEGTATSGALIGGVGAESDSKVQGNVKTTFGDNITVNADSLTVAANSATKQDVTSKLYSGGVVSVGVNKSNVTADVDAITTLGSGINITANTAQISAAGADTLYAHSVSGSGGAIDGSGAVVKTDNTSNSLVNIGRSAMATANNINAGTFTASAANTTTQDSKVEATSGSIVGAIVLQNENNSTMNVKVDLEGANNITANNMNFNAANNYVKNHFDYALDSTAGGVIGVPVATSENNISNYTDIIFGDDADLKTTKDSDGNSSFTANAYNDITSYDNGRLVSGALVSVPVMKNKIYNTNDYARITVNDAKIKTAGDLDFNVKSDVNLNAKTQISVYGGSAVAQGQSKAQTTINNNITLNNNADVFALGDVNFGLTQPNGGVRANMYTNAITDIWNKTGIPIEGGAEAKGLLDLNNNLNVASSAKLRSAKDINLRASDGIVGSSGLLHIYTANDNVTLATKDNAAQAEISQDSNFVLNGQILAGVNNIQNVTINADGSVTFTNPEADLTYTVTNESLSNNILNEIEYYKQLKAAYSSSAVLAGAYQAEIDRLQSELERLGQVEIAPDGSKLYSVVDNVDFITFSDISSNRGDINIDANSVTGSGKLSAPGYAEVTITNNSPLFLRLNDVLISDTSHGDIVYNGVKVASNGDINAVNSSGTAGFSSIATANSAADPVITVSNNYSHEGKSPYLELTGNIENKEGAVNIASEGSIYAKGNIRGTTINMNSGADVVQSYTDGFRHIGGEPSEQWASVASSAQTGKTDLNSDTAAKTGVSSIIGNNVFISGRYLNINGLVQSGVADWSLNIPSGALALANSFTTATAAADYNARVNRNEANVSELYALSSSYGNIPAFYNVLTGQIVIKDFAVEGGRLELYGHILNTGDTAGELRVLDGYGRVNITNNSGQDLVINTVDNNSKVSGVIKITDLAKTNTNGDFLTTTYTYNNGSITAVTNQATNNTTVTSGRTTAYDPLTGQRYVWTTGQESLTKETYTKSQNSFWGMDFIVPDESGYDKTTKLLSSSPLMEGEVIDLTDTSNTHTYSYDYTGPVVLSKIKTYEKRWTETHGWWIFSTKEYHHKLIYETGSKEYHKHSIKADYPIKVNFIGYDSAQTNITTNGNLLLASSVNAGTGNVNLTSSNGAINSLGEGSVSGANVNLTASTGIGTTQAVTVNVNGGALNAQTTSGDINLSAEAVKDSADHILNVAAGTISTGNGTVNLTADGSIVNAGSSSLISGNTVNLTSSVGTIGTDASALNIHAGTLSANAKDNINIKQASGDLGVNSISSGIGDVNLDVAGSVFDANEEASADTRTQTELLNTWNDMDLTGDAGWTLDQLKYAVNSSSLKNTVDTQYMSEAPNITGKNVTVKAGGSIGKNIGSEVIDLTNYSALTDEQKLLIASSESDNLLFSFDGADPDVPTSVTVFKTEDFDIHADSINLNANKYVYLGGEQDINVDAIAAGTGENITIRGARGIYNVSTSATPNITGNDFVAEGSGGSIGTAVNPLTLNLSGKIIARAQNNIYLASAGNIRVDSILAKEQAHLTSSADITNAATSGNTNISAAGIWLNAVNIGSDASALGLDLDQSNAAAGTVNAVNATASNNINIAGTTSDTLYTATITAGNNAKIAAVGDVLNASSAAKVTAVNASLGDVGGDIGTSTDKYNVEAQSISAHATGDIYLNAKAALFKDFDSTTGNIDIYSYSLNAAEFKNILAALNVKIKTEGAGTTLDNIRSFFGDIDVKAEQNNILVKSALTAASGKLNLTAYDSIENSSTAMGVFGAETNLTAQHGSIGTSATPFKVNGYITDGIVNASAAKDIFIAGFTDMTKLGRLEAVNGDIKLEADSSLEAVAQADGSANVKGNNITMHAQYGHIGTPNAFVTAEVNQDGGKTNLLAAEGIYVKNLLYTFFADYVKNTDSGDIVLDVPTNNVRINELQKQALFEVLLRGEKKQSGVIISDTDIKKLLVDPIAVHPPVLDIPAIRMDIFKGIEPAYFTIEEFAWNK